MAVSFTRHLLTLIMPTERELAISPIVQESVQHNTRVSLLYSFTTNTSLHSFPGHLKYPLPDSLSFWRCLWHSRSRVVFRLCLLPPGDFLCVSINLGIAGQGEARAVFPRATVGAVGRRCAWRWHELCLNLDSVLRTCEGIGNGE